MRRYTTICDCNVFGGLAHGLPEVEIEETTQPNPIEPPAADSSSVLAIVSSLLENISATLIATPATSEEELVACVTISAALADEPAKPPTPSKTNWQHEKSHKIRIPKMGEGAFLLYGSFCRECPLQSRRPLDMLLQS